MTDSLFSWDQISPGDRLRPIEYEITPPVHESFLISAAATPELTRLLIDDRGRSVAHPMQTLTDYSALIQQRYGPMGSGLHARHESTLLRPIPLDTPLTAEGSVVDKFVKRGRDYWIADYSVSDQEGVLVRHRMTSTIDRAENSAEPESSSSTPESTPTPRPQRTGATGPEDWTCHLTREITLPMIIDYDRQYWLRHGEAFRNAPNAHTSPEIARAAGLRDAVAHSSHYYGWLANVALQTYGPSWLYGGTLEARFVAPLFPGDTLAVESSEQPPGLRLRVVGDDGIVFATGTAASNS